MFLTTLDHGGWSWTVELKVIPREDDPGLLEFSFSRPAPDGTQARLTWIVSGSSLEALSRDGVEVSEDLLRHQLSLALAEQRTVDARGTGG
jgi:hypothetical protein